VRHGNYLSVYCQLDKINVKSGDKVKAGDILGEIAEDASGHTRLLFQLRQEKQKLNPTQWIKL
jgi:septal ring factor EnvC (AmiA/AmiB activator)